MSRKSVGDGDSVTQNHTLPALTDTVRESDVVHTVTSYFHPVWNAFSKHTDGSIQWIPKQIVTIGEDIRIQVGDGKVRTLCTKFVGDTTGRTTPGKPSHIYRDMVRW